ncbi:unnamed protein product, partial [Meganyctiphanes norvegica]
MNGSYHPSKMAGLDDYQFYSKMRERDTPFWQKTFDPKDQQGGSSTSSTDMTDLYQRPTEFPQKLTGPAAVPGLGAKPNMTSVLGADPFSGKDLQMEKYGELSINLVSLCAENLLSHPFIVIRRQCQVNVDSLRYHLLPVTLVPSILHLQSCQGFSCFWKGLGSVLTVRGVTMGLEDCISKFTPWPKEISPHSSLKTIGQHLLLKCSALALITPFYSASLVETVQSEIASERPGVLDVFKEGLMRLLSFTQPQTGRMLPVWLLIVPTVSHGILQYLIGNAVTTITSNLLRQIHRQDQQRKGAVSKESSSLADASVRLQATYIGHLASDIILFPLETILHRLHMQGTRTIIDSLDAGYEVKPILTRYEGFFDCLHTALQEEGVLGLFKHPTRSCRKRYFFFTMANFAASIIRELIHSKNPSRPKEKMDDPINLITPSTPPASILYCHHQRPHSQKSPLAVLAPVLHRTPPPPTANHALPSDQQSVVLLRRDGRDMAFIANSVVSELTENNSGHISELSDSDGGG